MAVDFSSLVLAPCQEVFGRPVTIDPVKSQPGAAPYAARGIFTSRQQDVAFENGEVLSTQVTTLGIREAEYPVLPTRGDGCLIGGSAYWVADISEDGQGQSVLALRKK